jgi:hypothetical protein
MLTRLWHWLLSFFPKEVIAGECPQLGPWMTRYTLFKRGRAWPRVFVHHIHRSDESREHLHDHPWSFVSVILRGGYWEETKAGRRFYRPGLVLVRPAEWAHRLELNPGAQAWSLVIAGPIWRDWGFHTAAGWVHWKRYDYKNLLCPED